MSGPSRPEEAGPERRESVWDRPQIYVASLSDYNAGILHGDWISAEVDPEVVQETIDQMLAESPTAERYGDVAEEWAIHDFSGFGRVHLSEHESLERVCAIAQGISAHGEAFAAWVADRAGDDLPTSEDFEEHFLGEWSSETEWGESLLDNFGIDLDQMPNVPDGLALRAHRRRRLGSRHASRWGDLGCGKQGWCLCVLGVSPGQGVVE